MSFVKNQQKLVIDNTGKVAEATSADTADTATTATTATTALTANSVSVPVMYARRTGSFSAYLTVPSEDVVFPICNSEVFDTDSAYNPSTGIYTIPSSGYYEAFFSATVSTDTATSEPNIRTNPIYLSITNISTTNLPLASWFYGQRMTGTLIVSGYLTAGAQIRPQVSGSSAGNGTVYDIISFGVKKIRN